MARIRSVHPGLFTDEAFMSASPMARLLLIGIWTEAWDDGVFEWKPVVLKARIFPADDCNTAILLEELAGLDVIKKVERGGKSYGLIRNFQKYQRPKKPNNSGIDTVSERDYLGFKEPEASDNPQPVPNQFRTSTEIPPQMEDGGCSRIEEDLRPKPQKRLRTYSEDFEAFWKAYPTDPIMSKKAAAGRWCALSAEDRGAAMAAVPAFRAYCAKNATYRPVHAERYLSQRRFDGFEAEKKGASTATPAVDPVSSLFSYWLESGRWLGHPSEAPDNLQSTLTDDQLSALGWRRGQKRGERIAGQAA